MANESGDMKLLGNFNQLIELISTNTDYNPSNTALTTAALNAQKAAAQAAVLSVGSTEAPYKSAVNTRQFAYEDLSPVVTRSGNMLNASGADVKINSDFKTLSRKINGQRKTAKVKNDPNVTTNQAEKSNSASQRSYDNILGNLNDLVALLGTVSSYDPNEPELKVRALQARSADLATKNQAVSSTYASMSAARGERDQLLYTNDDSVVNIAPQVKAYVRAAFGGDSQLYKQIKGIEFKKRPK